MLSHQVKEKLRKWSETPDNEKDYTEGCRILLEASGNRHMYVGLVARPEVNKDRIDYMLRKYIMFVLKEVTRDEVQEMQEQVNQIVRQDMSLIKEKDEAPPRGKREDHDSLPDDIKVLYVENLTILRRMRDLHLKLRNLSVYIRRSQVPCPDSERYPFLKEMIRLDKIYHENWEKYDHFVIKNEAEEDSKKDPADKIADDGSDTSDNEE